MWMHKIQANPWTCSSLHFIISLIFAAWRDGEGLLVGYDSGKQAKASKNSMETWISDWDIDFHWYSHKIKHVNQ